MCKHIATTFDAHPSAPAQARRFCSGYLAHAYTLGSSERALTFAADTALVTKELVAMLIDTGSPHVTYVLSAHHAYLRLFAYGELPGEIERLNDAATPAPAHPRAILSGLTTRWGSFSSTAANTVWAEIAIPPEISATFACTRPHPHHG